MRIRLCAVLVGIVLISLQSGLARQEPNTFSVDARHPYVEIRVVAEGSPDQICHAWEGPTEIDSCVTPTWVPDDLDPTALRAVAQVTLPTSPDRYLWTVWVQYLHEDETHNLYRVSKQVLVDFAIFRDGFETGDTRAWRGGPVPSEFSIVNPD